MSVPADSRSGPDNLEPDDLERVLTTAQSENTLISRYGDEIVGVLESDSRFLRTIRGDGWVKWILKESFLRHIRSMTLGPVPIEKFVERYGAEALEAVKEDSEGFSVDLQSRIIQANPLDEEKEAKAIVNRYYQAESQAGDSFDLKIERLPDERNGLRIRILVDSAAIGRFIGKGGEKTKGLIAKLGAEIQVKAVVAIVDRRHTAENDGRSSQSLGTGLALSGALSESAVVVPSIEHAKENSASTALGAGVIHERSVSQPYVASERSNRPIKFLCLGGAAEIGRSCYLLCVGESKFIVLDAGGPSNLGQRQIRFREILSGLPDFEIIAVLISHAHADHIGGLPLLLEALRELGRPAPQVYMSEETREVMPTMLMDSIRRRKADGLPVGYDEGLVNEIYDSAQPVKPGDEVRIGENVRLRLIRNNHIPGAAMIHLDIGGTGVLYTGDVKFGKTFLYGGISYAKYAQELLGIDLAICESTYAAQPPSRYDEEFEQLKTKVGRVAAIQQTIGGIIKEVVQRNGAVLIPVFALGRTQEVLNMLKRIADEVPEIAKTPKYVAGLGMTLSEKLGFELPEGFQRINFVRQTTTDAVSDLPMNRVLNKERPVIIVTTPGMPENGLASAFLAKLVGEEESAIIAVGYQDDGSPLRTFSGVRKGEVVSHGSTESTLMCDVYSYGLEGHEPARGIADFMALMQPRNVFVVHGTPRAEEKMKARIEEYIENMKKKRLPHRTVVTPCSSGSLYVLDPSTQEVKEERDFVRHDSWTRVTPILIRFQDAPKTIEAIDDFLIDYPMVYEGAKHMLAYLTIGPEDVEKFTGLLDLVGARLESRPGEMKDLSDYSLNVKVHSAVDNQLSILGRYLPADRFSLLKTLVTKPSCSFGRLDDSRLGELRGHRLSVNKFLPFLSTSGLYDAVVDHQVAHAIQQAAMGVSAFDRAPIEFKEGFAEYMTYVIHGKPLYRFENFDDVSYMKEIVSHRSNGIYPIWNLSVEERMGSYDNGFAQFKLIEMHQGREKALELGLFGLGEFIRALADSRERWIKADETWLGETVAGLGITSPNVKLSRDGMLTAFFTLPMDVNGASWVKKVRGRALKFPKNAVMVFPSEHFKDRLSLRMASYYSVKWTANDSRSEVKAYLNRGNSYLGVSLPGLGIWIEFEASRLPTGKGAGSETTGQSEGAGAEDTDV